jgi:hypothetical protein
MLDEEPRGDPLDPTRERAVSPKLADPFEGGKKSVLRQIVRKGRLCAEATQERSDP